MRSLPLLQHAALVLSLCGLSIELLDGCSTSTSTAAPIRPAESPPDPPAPDEGTAPTPEDDTPPPEPTPNGKFDLNDVSVLFPLPSDDTLWRANAKGAFGALLPKDLFDSVAVPDGQPVQGVPAYDALRVVGLRVDPCFPSLQLAPSCRAQVRLVLQPVSWAGATAKAEDRAVHLLYDIPTADFEKLLGQVTTLKNASGISTAGLPLAVHPALAKEGLGGAFAKGLRAAVLEKIGSSRLTRVAVTALPSPDGQWVFFGADVDKGAAKPITIAEANFTQQVIQGIGDNKSLSPETNKAISPFINFSGSPSKADLDAAESASLRIENPTLVDVDSVSCGGCHIAGSARQRAEKKWGLSSLNNPNLFTSKDFDISVSGPLDGDINVVRAFGYKGAVSVVSQRVVNDTAAVASYLNANTH